MTKKQRCESKKTFACYNGLGGLEAKEIVCGIHDYLYVVAGTRSKKKSYHKLRIYFDGKGGYVKLHGQKCRFSEFINCMEGT